MYAIRSYYVLGPLGMVDTGFVVPEGQRHRFTAYYCGADPLDPMKPGLTRADHLPYPQAYLRPVPKLSGGGGLVSTLPDMVALVRSLLPGGPTLLKPETIRITSYNVCYTKLLRESGYGQLREYLA